MGDLMVHVVSAAVIRQGRILLAQRAWNTSYSLKWCTPGGKRKEGENLVDALCRELHEEIGVTVKPDDIGPAVYDVAITSLDVHLTCYLIDWTPEMGNPSIGDGTAGLGWFDLYSLVLLPLTPADETNRAALMRLVGW